MIPRYNRPNIENIWKIENKFKIWTDIEILIAEKLSHIGIIPKIAAKEIRKKAKFNVKEINKLEKETKHDVVAYINNVSKYIGKQSKFFHYGVTSSDIIDTGFSIQLKQTGEIIRKQLKTLLKNLKSKSLKYKYTQMIGRSHGIHAEPITFGLKLGSFYNEFKRNLNRLELAIEEISICSISGPVGTYDSIDPSVEKHVAKKFKLKCEDVSTQVIPRDRHAMYFSILSVIATSIDRLATEIRHLQRTEVREVEEFFSKGQKGSSAMPHKRNPVLTENLSGLSRIIRSSVIPALENVSLWHERDISHSSVERMMAPDTTITLDFAISRLTSVIEKLIIYPEVMLENLNNLGGLVFSQQILLSLTKKGLSREKAYKLVQKNAMKVWEQPVYKRKDLFKNLLLIDKEVRKVLTEKEIVKQFDFNYHTKQIDEIFKRVFKE